MTQTDVGLVYYGFKGHLGVRTVFIQMSTRYRSTVNGATEVSPTCDLMSENYLFLKTYFLGSRFRTMSFTINQKLFIARYQESCYAKHYVE